MLNSTKQMLTVNEVAEMFNICPRTVYRWLSKGLLPAIRVGNVTRISRQDLDTFIKTYTNTTTKGSSVPPEVCG